MSTVPTADSVLGFDLGDGESSLALCATVGDNEPDVLRVVDGKQSFLTCLGRDAGGRVLLGEQALEASQVNSVHLTFKRLPSTDDGTARAIAAEFFCEVLKQAEASGCGLAHARIVVGHPSAWSEGDVAGYTRALSDRFGRPVHGVSESRGAFLQLKESSRLTVAQLKSATLIVDIGSSTTDFTLIKNLSQQPVEFGHNALGGRLIDRAILSLQIERDAARAKLERILGQHKHIYSRCEHLCRLIKEKYFTREADLIASGESLRSNHFVEIDDESIFKARLNALEMRAILDKPQSDLGGKGWKQAFQETLQHVRAQCGAADDLPKTIAMTGGGSRMVFTHEICREIFPEAQLISDVAPEFCIVKGLARAGRWDCRSESFLGELEPLTKLLPDAFRGEISAFVASAVPELSAEFAQDVVRQGLLDWRTGKVETLNHLEGHLKSLGNVWAKSNKVKAIVQRAVSVWTDRAMLKMGPALNDVSRRYGLPLDTLNITVTGEGPRNVQLQSGKINEDDLRLFSHLAGGVAGLVAIKVAIIVTPVILVFLTKAAIITSVMTGPVGWLIGGAIVAGSYYFGKEKAEAMIKGSSLPLMMRNLLMTDAKIEAACQQTIPEIQATLEKELMTSAHKDIIGAAVDAVREVLIGKMKEAMVLLGR